MKKIIATFVLLTYLFFSAVFAGERNEEVNQALVNEGVELFNAGELGSAKALFERASRDGWAPGKWALAHIYMAEEYEDKEKVVKLLEAAADMGHIESLRLLAKIHYLGHVVEKNRDGAIFYLKKAVEEFNDAHSAGILGNIYSGDFKEPDYQKAAYWYEKSIPEASKTVYPRYTAGVWALDNGKWETATILFTEILSEKRSGSDLLIEVLELAAADNNVAAMRHLGELYTEGYKVEQDELKGEKYYKLAADSGDVLGIQAYADYLDEKGYLKEGLKYWLKGAKLDCYRCQIEVSESFIHGEGVDENADRAIYWLERAVSTMGGITIELTRLWAKAQSMKSLDDHDWDYDLSDTEGTKYYFSSEATLGHRSDEDGKQVLVFIYEYLGSHRNRHPYIDYKEASYNSMFKSYSFYCDTREYTSDTFTLLSNGRIVDSGEFSYSWDGSHVKRLSEGKVLMSLLKKACALY